MHTYSIYYLLCGSYIHSHVYRHAQCRACALGLFQFTFSTSENLQLDLTSCSNTSRHTCTQFQKIYHFSLCPQPIIAQHKMSAQRLAEWDTCMCVCLCVDVCVCVIVCVYRCTCKRLCMNLKSAYAYVCIVLWRKSYWLLSVGRSPCLLAVQTMWVKTHEDKEKN